MRRAGGEVLAVAFAAEGRLEGYAEEMGLPLPLLHDPDRRAYRAYGLGAGRVWDVWGPSTWWAYLRLFLAGRRWRGIQADPSQLGGDVLVGPDGRIAYLHRSRAPADRPDAEGLVSRLEALGRS